MAGTAKKTGIDDKIQAAQDKVFRMKDRYDAAVAELNALLKKKKEMEDARLMKAIENSTRSYDEIMAFLSGEQGENE